MLDGLVAADGPAALHAHAGVLHAELEHALGGADHLGAPGEGAEAAGGSEQRPPASGRGEPIVRAVSTSASSSSKSLSPVMLSSGCAVMPARSSGQQEGGWPGGGLPEHDHVGRHVRVRDEQLASGEAAGRHDGQGQPRRVESSRLLEHGERADPLAHRQGGEQCVGASSAGRGQRGGGHHRARDERAREAGAPQLLDEGQRVADGAAAAPQLRRDQEARPAERRDLLPQIGREAPRVECPLLHALGRAALLEKGRAPTAAGAAATARRTGPFMNWGGAAAARSARHCPSLRSPRLRLRLASAPRPPHRFGGSA